MNIYIATVDSPGHQVFIDNNPPPDIDTITSFFLQHFMTLLSEENMPVTSVMQYVKEIGIRNTDLFIDVMMRAYGHYMSLVNKQNKEKANGK